MAEKPTDDELRRVREWACETEGHSFSVVNLEQSFEPQLVICDRCGRTWKINPAEKEPS